MAGGYDGSVRIKADLNHRNFDRGLSSMTNSVKKFGNTLSKVAGLVGVAFGTVALINFGKEAIKAASALNDAWMGLESIVTAQGKSFSRAKSFIEDYISDGLVPLENAVTAYKNLAARGYSTEQIEQTMVALKDAAAFGRQASYSLGDAVTSATEGLKNENSILVDNAGVTKNVAKMWDDYARSIGTTANKLTQEQKIQAEVNGILQETRFQTGDAAKLVTTYSGQVALLGFNFQKLKVEVGNALIPIAKAALPGINAIIASLTKLASVFSKVTALLFGKSADVKETGGIASSASSASSATDELADSLGGAGDAAKKAGKDMKSVTAPFDEFNILADNAASSLGDIAGGLDMGGAEAELPEIDVGGEMFEDAEVNPKIEQAIQRIIDRLMELKEILAAGFEFGLGDTDFSGLEESLKNIGGYLVNIFTAEDVTAAANRFVDSLVFTIGTLAGAFVSVGVTIMSALLGGIELFLGENSERIKDWIVKMFDVGTEINQLVSTFAAAFADVFSVFGEEDAQRIVASVVQIFSDIFGTNLLLAVKFSQDVIDAITTPFVENKDLIKETLRGFLEPVAKVMDSIKELVRKAVDGIVSVYDEHIHPFIMSVKASFTEWFETMLNGWNTYIKPVLDNLAEKFDKVVQEHIVPMIEKALEFAGKLIDGIKLLWDSVLSPLVNWIIQEMAPKIANQIEFIGNIFNIFLATVSDVVGGILTALGGIIDFVTGVFTGDWEKAWEGIKGIFKGMWDAMGGIVRGAVNFIVTAVTRLWNDIMQGAATLWSGIVSIFQFVGDWFKAHVSVPIGEAFEAAGNFIKTVFNNIMGSVEGLINGAIRGINWLIAQLNKIHFDVPSWVPGIGGKNFGFNISSVSEVRLPRLANGAVIPPNRQFAAILGDQRSGKNIEAPISLIRQAVTEGIQAAGGMGNNQPIQVNVILERKVLATAMVNEINRMTRSGGKSPLLA